MKRAQTATEYLIILAVVIIIALIVVAVMGGIPGIGGQTSERQARSNLQTQVIAVTGYAANTEQLSITIRNNHQNSVDVTDIAFNEDQTGCGGFETKTLTPGESVTVLCENSLVSAGARYEIPIAIRYVDRTTNAEFNQARGTALVGTAGN